jgi:hypothetical protein
MCPCEYTSKLERMFQDIGVSKTTTEEYGKFCADQQLTGLGIRHSKNKNIDWFSLVDFSVMVLNSNLWPFSVLPNIVLPIEVR